MAHALREHARERIAKNAATSIGANILAQVLGLGQVGQTLAGYGAQLLTLRFSRGDESEADLVGMEIAARAGYDPRAAISLWQKMGQAGKSAPPRVALDPPVRAPAGSPNCSATCRGSCRCTSGRSPGAERCRRRQAQPMYSRPVAASPTKSICDSG